MTRESLLIYVNQDEIFYLHSIATIHVVLSNIPLSCRIFLMNAHKNTKETKTDKGMTLSKWDGLDYIRPTQYFVRNLSNVFDCTFTQNILGQFL